MIEPERVYTAARQVLDAVERHYDHVSVDLPDRRYVSDGQPAWDCEQCVVYVERVFPGLSDMELPQAIDPAGVRSARLWVEVVRCTPTLDDAPTYPSPTEIESNAMLVLADSVLTWQAIRVAQQAGDLGACHSLVLDDWQALGPAGGYAGGRLGLRIQLDSV